MHSAVTFPPHRRSPDGTRNRNAASWAVWFSLVAFSLAAPVLANTDSPSRIGEAPLFSIGGLDYTPGRGLRFGESGIVVGGFANLKAETTDEAGEEFAVDAVNVFVIFDRYERFRAVGDLELKDMFAVDESGSGTQDFALNVRRLFADLIADDSFVVRAGTFLTPIGYWNLILAPPLTSTTEAPLIVDEALFEVTTTGLMLHGNASVGEGVVSYALFSQFLKPLENDPELDPPDNTIGFRIIYERLPGWSVGASYQSAEKNGQWSHLGGLHTRWEIEPAEILAETYYQDGSILSSEQWGGFVQATVEIVRPFSLVGRIEHFAPADPEPAVNVFTVGGVWRPLSFMALKLEYRLGDRKLDGEDLDGLFASFSTFF